MKKLTRSEIILVQHLLEKRMNFDKKLVADLKYNNTGAEQVEYLQKSINADENLLIKLHDMKE